MTSEGYKIENRSYKAYIYNNIKGRSILPTWPQKTGKNFSVEQKLVSKNKAQIKRQIHKLEQVMTILAE